jgi:hypothetical protein
MLIRGALSIPQRYELMAGLNVPVAIMLAPWWRAELVATPRAQARLRQWCVTSDEASLEPWTRERVLSQLEYYGDGEQMMSVVAAALAQLPPPIIEYVLSHAVFFGVGWRTNGWIGRMPPCAGKRLVVVSGAWRDAEVLQRTVTHEAAHCWLEDFSTAPLREIDLQVLRLAAELSPAHAGDAAAADEVVYVAESRAEALTDYCLSALSHPDTPDHNNNNESEEVQMDTKRIRVEIDLPKTEEVFLRGLSIDVDPGVVKARRAIEDARREVEALEVRSREAAREVERVRQDVADGRRTIDDLERVVAASAAREQTVALMLPRQRQILVDAEAAYNAEVDQAKQRLHREGQARLELLQRAARLLTPMLEQIQDLEVALETACPGMPFVEWPASARDNIHLYGHARGVRAKVS